MRLLTPQYQIDQTSVPTSNFNSIQLAREVLPDVKAEIERSLNTEDYMRALMACNDIHWLFPEEAPGFFTTGEMREKLYANFLEGKYGQRFDHSMAGYVSALLSIFQIPRSATGWDTDHFKSIEMDLVNTFNAGPVGALSWAIFYKFIYPEQDIAGLFQPYAFKRIIQAIDAKLEEESIWALINLMYVRILWPENFDQIDVVKTVRKWNILDKIAGVESMWSRTYFRAAMALAVIMASSCELSPTGLVLGAEVQPDSTVPLPHTLNY